MDFARGQCKKGAFEEEVGYSRAVLESSTNTEGFDADFQPERHFALFKQKFTQSRLGTIELEEEYQLSERVVSETTGKESSGRQT